MNYVNLRGTLEDRFNDDRGDGGVVCVGENLDDVRDQLRVLLVGQLSAVVETSSLQKAVGLGKDTDTWTTQRSIRSRDCSRLYLVLIITDGRRLRNNGGFFMSFADLMK